jgi:hypothetical protein
MGQQETAQGSSGPDKAKAGAGAPIGQPVGEAREIGMAEMIPCARCGASFEPDCEVLFGSLP